MKLHDSVCHRPFEKALYRSVFATMFAGHCTIKLLLRKRANVERKQVCWSVPNQAVVRQRIQDSMVTCWGGKKLHFI